MGALRLAVSRSHDFWAAYVGFLTVACSFLSPSNHGWVATVVDG